MACDSPWPGSRLVKVGRRLVARPTTEVHARPSVDIAGLVEDERNRWPPRSSWPESNRAAHDPEPARPMSFTLSEIVPWGRSLPTSTCACSDWATPSCACEFSVARMGRRVSTRRAHAAVRGSCRAIRSINSMPWRFVSGSMRRRRKCSSRRARTPTRSCGAPFRRSTSSAPSGWRRWRNFSRITTGACAGQRYLAASLPSLPFADGSFDLALCSHFLFLYSERLDADFHAASVLELCRVARQVRIFPLLSLDGRRSPWIEPVCDRLRGAGHVVSLPTVDYEFQRGGNQMMEIRRGSCSRGRQDADEPTPAFNERTYA